MIGQLKRVAHSLRSLFHLRRSYELLWRLLFVATMFDVVTYALWSVIQPANGTEEKNVITVFLAAVLGVAGFAVFKLVYTLFIRTWLRRNRFTWRVYSALALATATTFVGSIFNVWSLLR